MGYESTSDKIYIHMYVYAFSVLFKSKPSNTLRIERTLFLYARVSTSEQKNT